MYQIHTPVKCDFGPIVCEDLFKVVQVCQTRHFSNSALNTQLGCDQSFDWVLLDIQPFVLQCSFHLVFGICALHKKDLLPQLKLFKPTVFSAVLPNTIFWHIHTSLCNYRGILATSQHY